MVKKLLVGFMMVVVLAGVGYAQTPMQRCFTFTGNVRANAPNNAGPIVASMGTGWVSQTPFYQQGVTGGMSVAYKICVNEDGLLANIESSTLYTIGGSGDPANGYPRPSAAFDHIYYNDPNVDTQILVGDPNEYIQILLPILNFGLPLNQVVSLPKGLGEIPTTDLIEGFIRMAENLPC